MKTLIVIAGMVGSFIALSLSAHLWLPRLLLFAKVNADAIQSITSMVQLAIWLCAGAVAVAGFWFSRKKAAPVLDPNPPDSKVVSAGGSRAVAIGQATNNKIITGDNNVVIEQAHFTIEKPPPEEITYSHQLPPESSDFTDRVDEVTLLETKLGKGICIYGFFGMSGVGKSDLAKRFIHRYLSGGYPDAQFYIDLMGTTETPKTVSQAQRHVISSCQTLTKAFETKDVELDAKYHSALHGKRAVLFLDNASSKEQVVPLTPHENCAMVITSRQKIVLSGMYWMDLSPLKPEDARDLLLKIEPRIGDHADQIAKLCGGLPQALRLAASTLAEHQDLSVEEYVKRLNDRKNRLEFVEASLDLSYKLLSTARQKQFSQLAVFPETFDVGGAAAVWGLTPDEAKFDLGEFVRLSLLEWHSNTNRYRLQTLVRDFSESHLAEPDRSLVRSRHALYYLRVLNEAGHRYLQGQEVSRDGINLFDVERTNILYAQIWIQTQSTDAGIAQLAIENYGYGGSQLLALKELPVDRIAWHQTILDATRKLISSNDDEQKKVRIAEAGNLIFLGAAQCDLSDYPQTIKLCEEAAPIAREVGKQREESNALGYSGIAYYYTGNYQEACNHILQAIEVANNAENKDVRGDVERLRYLGHSYRALGNYDDAFTSYQSSLRMAREFGDLRGENATLSGLGKFACDTGNHFLARTDYFPKALSLAKEIGDYKNQCYALGHLGFSHRETGLYTEAKEFYQQAIEIAVLIRNLQLETYCRGGLAKTELALGDLANALSYAQMAVKLADQIKMKRAQEYWRTLVAQVYLSNNQHDDALNTLTDALAYKSEWVDYRSLTLQGLVLAKLKRNQAATDSFKEAIVQAQKILGKTPIYFDARYFHAIAACGIAAANPNETNALVTESITVLEQAYDNCKSAGVVNEVLGLLKIIEAVDSREGLDKPRLALEQLASSNQRA